VKWENLQWVCSTFVSHEKLLHSVDFQHITGKLFLHIFIAHGAERNSRTAKRYKKFFLYILHIAEPSMH